MRSVEHTSHGVPLETYELIRRDHADQRTWESIHQHVAEEAAKMHAEEAVDPELRERRIAKAVEVWEIINRGQRPDHEIMRWRVRLYCGHIVETSRHVATTSPRDHGSSSMTCPVCGKKPSGIVAWEPIGLKAPNPATTASPAPPPVTRQPTRAQLERQVCELREEVQRLILQRHLPHRGGVCPRRR